MFDDEAVDEGDAAMDDEDDDMLAASGAAGEDDDILAASGAAHDLDLDPEGENSIDIGGIKRSMAPFMENTDDTGSCSLNLRREIAI